MGVLDPSLAEPRMDVKSGDVKSAAPVLEVFASYQGEGLYVGQPQVFLRLFGCPLRCRWCDTPGSWSIPREATARVRRTGSVESEEAWATPFRAATWITSLDPEAKRAVSVTGGEPLLWPEFLRSLPDFLGGRRLHLETAGGHPAALERVLPAVDHVSLDLKLPDDLDPPETDPATFERARGGPERAVVEATPHTEGEWADARERCLELVKGQDAAVKIIVTGGRSADDYEELLDDVERLAPELPLFLQPVTPLAGVRAPKASELHAVVDRALEHGLAARVVPQVHRFLRLP